MQAAQARQGEEPLRMQREAKAQLRTLRVLLEAYPLRAAESSTRAREGWIRIRTIPTHPPPPSPPSRRSLTQQLSLSGNYERQHSRPRNPQGENPMLFAGLDLTSRIPKGLPVTVTMKDFKCFEDSSTLV